MDAALFERLLNEEEGATLDFKRDQYLFAGANDEAKSELLKDILAFANAWRRTDAYILIGVEEVRGGRSNVFGVTSHLDDHSLQQFVSHKTNRPPHFSYEASTFDGKQVGIIKIDQQARPFYLKADYGKLKKNVVYVRRGSSTCEADLDEVARMGSPAIQEEADLRLEFAALDREAGLGTTLRLQAVCCEMPTGATIPDYEGPQRKRHAFYDVTASIANRPNEAYYREKATFLYAIALFRPVRFLVTNAGAATAQNVRVELAIARQAGALVLSEPNMPAQPEKDRWLATMRGIGPAPHRQVGHVSVEEHADKFKIIVECGTLQPKRAITSNKLFLGLGESGEVKLTGLIYAENLSSPKSVELLADFTVAHKQVSVSELIAENR